MLAMISHTRTSPELNTLLTRGEGLTELVSLLGVLDDKSVQVARASDLELDVVSVLLDGSG
jgi:hypothetical protein